MLISRILLYPFIICFVSAADFPNDKSFKTKEMKRKFFGDDYVSCKSEPIHNDDVKPSRSAPNDFNFDLLPDELLMKIFECLIEAHAPLRLVSRKFRRIYDNCTYKMSISIFPALSGWPAEDLKYQLIPLSNVLYFNIKPLVAQYVAEQDLLADTNLRHHSIQLIIFLQAIDLEACLKLANSLLKLGIVNWQDVNDLLLFTNNPKNVQLYWSLGLTTFAHEMHSNNLETFYASIMPPNNGILTAIQGKHLALSKFMISSLIGCSVEFRCRYFDYFESVISELIKAGHWCVLRIIYELYNDYFHPCQFKAIAEQGCIDGLRALIDLIKIDRSGFGYCAAANGHVDFLKEMCVLGLLKETRKLRFNVYDAFKGASICRTSECLEFLIEKFGKKYLSKVEFLGQYIPIHYAAVSGGPETIWVILRHYPFYKPRFIDYPFCRAVSPVHYAVSCGRIENIKVLLEYFPELINFKDQDKNTILHESANNQFCIFEEILNIPPPPEIIIACNKKGNTVLDLAVSAGRSDIISILMRTGLF